MRPWPSYVDTSLPQLDHEVNKLPLSPVQVTLSVARSIERATRLPVLSRLKSEFHLGRKVQLNHIINSGTSKILVPSYLYTKAIRVFNGPHGTEGF